MVTDRELINTVIADTNISPDVSGSPEVRETSIEHATTTEHYTGEGTSQQPDAAGPLHLATPSSTTSQQPGITGGLFNIISSVVPKNSSHRSSLDSQITNSSEKRSMTQGKSSSSGQNPNTGGGGGIRGRQTVSFIVVDDGSDVPHAPAVE